MLHLGAVREGVTFRSTGFVTFRSTKGGVVVLCYI